MCQKFPRILVHGPSTPCRLLHSPNNKPTMTRLFGTKISGNARPRKELTPFERGKIIAWHKDGQVTAEIRACMHIPKSTIQYTIATDPTCNNSHSVPWPGCPKVYTDQDE